MSKIHEGVRRLSSAFAFCIELSSFAACPVRDLVCRCYPARNEQDKEYDMEGKEGIMLGTILIVVLILVLIGALPTWPHSRSWGYYPTGGIGLILAILVILVLLGRI